MDKIKNENNVNNLRSISSINFPMGINNNALENVAAPYKPPSSLSERFRSLEKNELNIATK